MDILNILLALASIAFGAIGWFAPRFTMRTLDLVPGPSNMGISEVRAASGALFVGMGTGALVLGTPFAFAMIGFCWGGAAVGRATSLALDGMSRKKLTYCAVEVVVAALALSNLFIMAPA